MSVIITILMLSVLIVVHEFGHFIVARLNGVQVQEFALGMGPQLWKKQSAKSGTKYSLRLFPIGGYVKMLGDEGEELEGTEDPEKTFYQKSVWRRISIIVAGPLMNFVVAILLFIVAFVGLGTPSNEPVIGEAVAGGSALAAGMEAGDRVLAVDGQAMISWQQLSQYIRDSQGQEMTLEIDRGGQQLTVQATATLEPSQGIYLLGIQQATERRSILNAIQLGFTETYEFTKQILLTFVGMFTGEIEPELTGPVGMTTIVGQVAQNGLFRLLLFIGVISINLGVVNLFPLPALDGGRVVFMLIEAVRGKPLDPAKENMVHLIGLVALMGLMVLITYQDIVRLIRS